MKDFTIDRSFNLCSDGPSAVWYIENPETFANGRLFRVCPKSLTGAWMGSGTEVLLDLKFRTRKSVAAELANRI